MRLCETCAAPIGDDHPFTVCPKCLFGTALNAKEVATSPDPFPFSQNLPHLGKAMSQLPVRTDFFEKYEIIERVAQGGQGDIWHVWDLELRRPLAMKRLSERSMKSEPALSRFLAEAQIASQLDHPGILPIFDFGFDPDDRAFYTTQLLPGTTLADVWRKVHDPQNHEWTIHRALEMVLRICEIMSHAHSRGVVHRDLKPTNILVGSFGDVRVIDWGSAYVLENARKDFEQPFIRLDQELVQTDRREALWAQPDSPLSTAHAGQPITVLFVPPEILSGQTNQLGPQTDVYSIGVMLYELLTRRLPYSREDGSLPDPAELRELILHTSPSPVRHANPTISPDLAAICEKAMSPTKAERYATMPDLAQDLRAFLEVRPVGARHPGVVLKLQKWAQRNASYVLLGGTILLSMMATNGKA